MTRSKTILGTVSGTTSVGIALWRIAGRLGARGSNRDPGARRWVRLGIAALSVAGLAAVAAAVVDLDGARRARLKRDVRLDEELMESFPASDAPALTRS